MHEEERYPCSQCKYSASTASHLKTHVAYKHEGVRYPCSQCMYVAITANALKKHVESKHGGVPNVSFLQLEQVT